MGDFDLFVKTEEEDGIYHALADGHPGIVEELIRRACITYPTTSELVLVTVLRHQENKTNETEIVKEYLENMMDGLSLRSEDLEFELQRAYRSGKTKMDIIDQVLSDLVILRDPGMDEKIRKYEPLIEFKGDYIWLTKEAESLLSRKIVNKPIDDYI